MKERGNKKRNNIFSPKNLLIGFVVIIVLLFAFNYFYPAFSNKNSNIDENSGLGKLFSVICVPAIGRGCYPEYPHHISGPYDTYEKCKEACEEGNNLENAHCRNCRQEKYKSEDGKDEYYCVYWDSNNGDSCKIFPDIFSGSDDMIVIDGYKSTCLKGNCLKCEGGCLSCQTCVGENICKNPGIGEPGGCPEDTPDPDNSVCYKCEFDPKTCTSKWVKEKDGPISNWVCDPTGIFGSEHCTFHNLPKSVCIDGKVKPCSECEKCKKCDIVNNMATCVTDEGAICSKWGGITTGICKAVGRIYVSGEYVDEVECV